MKDLLVKLSAVCFAAADELERKPTIVEVPVEVKTAAVVPVTPVVTAPLSKFASTFRDATGEEIPAALAEKLAADADVADAFSKLAASKAPRRSLGRASDMDTGFVSASTKEGQVKQAYDNFENLVLGRNS